MPHTPKLQSIPRDVLQHTEPPAQKQDPSLEPSLLSVNILHRSSHDVFPGDGGVTGRVTGRSFLTMGDGVASWADTFITNGVLKSARCVKASLRLCSCFSPMGVCNRFKGIARTTVARNTTARWRMSFIVALGQVWSLSLVQNSTQSVPWPNDIPRVLLEVWAEVRIARSRAGRSWITWSTYTEYSMKCWKWLVKDT